VLGISSATGRFHPTLSDFITAGNFIARQPLRTRKLRPRPVDEVLLNRGFCKYLFAFCAK